MLEYFLFFYEFLKTTEKRSIIPNLIISVAVGVFIFFCSENLCISSKLDSIQSDILSVVGILLGFSFSVFTIFLTADGTNIDKAKKDFLEGVMLHGEKVSLYKSIIISFTFIIILEGILLLYSMIYPLISLINSLGNRICFAISIFILALSILMTLRLVLDFYFIITKKEENDDTNR